MVHKYFAGVVPETGKDTESEAVIRRTAADAIAAFGPDFDAMNFSEALRRLWILVAEADGYLTANAPWKKPPERSDADHARLQARVLVTAAEAIRIITALVYPILPDAAAKVWRQLGQGEIADAAINSFLANLGWGGLKAGTKFGEPAPLFPRAEKDAIDRMQNLEDENNRSAVEAASKGYTVAPERAPAATSVAPIAAANDAAMPTTAAPLDPAKPVGTAKVHQVPKPLASSRLNPTPAIAPASAPLTPPADAAASAPTAALQTPEHITIDDFVKVDLRVAQILVAERVPKADKLLRLEVDLGYEKRQILAGIAQHYEPEKLVGRKIVIVANLAPRKMRGLESNGMLLAASLPDGAPVLAGFLEEVPLGARLK
jgi:methionyl-tRNA synthetase